MDSDEALFERLIAGDMRAFDRLYDRFERPLFGFLRARLGDASEAEDVLHEAFMAVLRERDRRSEVRSFRAWLYQVANNLCHNRLRARRRAGRVVQEAAYALVADSAPLAPHAEQALEEEQRVAVLLDAVERLPAALADVYRLRATGMSYDEVAAALDVPVGTVKSRMHEMVKRLREEIRR
jgi:RNA polymerase sigma-70 factor (ECF subfamily)